MRRKADGLRSPAPVARARGPAGPAAWRRRAAAAGAVVLAAVLGGGCALPGPSGREAQPASGAERVPGAEGRSPARGAATARPATTRLGWVESIRELRRDASGGWVSGDALDDARLRPSPGPGAGRTPSEAEVGEIAPDTQRAYEVTVRFDDGSRATLRQAEAPDLQPNMRVAVTGARIRRY